MPARRSYEVDLDSRQSHAGKIPSGQEIVELFHARGDAVDEICNASDALRREVCGETVTNVVNRNFNYTNLCTYECTFCALSNCWDIHMGEPR